MRLTGLNGTRNHNEIKVTEKWIDGVDLKLWEVSNYWREVEMKARRKDALMPPPSSIIGNFFTYTCIYALIQISFRERFRC